MAVVVVVVVLPVNTISRKMEMKIFLTSMFLTNPCNVVVTMVVTVVVMVVTGRLTQCLQVFFCL